MADQPEPPDTDGPHRPNTKPIVAAIIIGLMVVAGVVGWQTQVFFQRSLETKQQSQENGDR